MTKSEKLYKPLKEVKIIFVNLLKFFIQYSMKNLIIQGPSLTPSRNLSLIQVFEIEKSKLILSQILA